MNLSPRDAPLVAAATACLFLALAPGAAPANADEAAESAAAVATASGRARRCEFIPGTLVPRLVMGVRRIEGPEITALTARAEPAADSAVVATLPLFRPYYVAARVGDPGGRGRLLIQDGYSAERALGWVDEGHVEPFRSRYAYTYAPGSREHLADLHDTSKACYERLLGQQNGGVRQGEDLVLVRERDPKAREPWSPATLDDLVPFIELRLPTEEIEPDYPDTTPTRRFGIRRENRIVHMGAVVGGPGEVRRPDGDLHGLEMVFVVDETESMKPFFDGVAAFVEGAGRAAARQSGDVRLAVCFYTDGPPGTRVTATRLQAVTGEQDAVRLGAALRNHREKLPPGDYAFPPERMLEGLRDSIRQAGFSAGARAFVAVVGDTGHDPANRDEKAALVREVAELVDKHEAHLFFAHVGRRTTEHDTLFEKDAAEVRRAVVALGLPADRVMYQPVEEATLAAELGRAEEQAAARRRERLGEIRRLESRTPHTEPGPRLLRRLAAAGITPVEFERRHLQIYAPARGWLFHPLPVDEAATQAPQFRELFFLAAEEQKAVDTLFVHLRRELAEGTTRIDHDLALDRFAAALAHASGAAALATQVRAEWERIPRGRRSIGVFLEDVFGLRLKAALPYPAEPAADLAATAEEIGTLSARIDRLRQSLSTDGREAVWFDASSLVP